MTRFSIITPARNAAAFAGTAFCSVDSQTFASYEVIVVDDHSTDTTRDVIGEFVARNTRVVPVFLPEPQGAGGARMAGVQRASGDYLLFLDIDDAFADPDVLGRMHEELVEAGEPDVLIYDFAYVDFAAMRQCTRHSAGTRGSQILGSLPSSFTLASHPETLRVSWVPWNKAYRRVFAQSAGLAFPPGYYEDALWTAMALLCATRLRALPQQLVSYRCCRHDSYSRKPDAGHMGILDKYQRIAEFMQSRPDLGPPGVRKEMLSVMAGFLAEMADRRGVIPEEDLPQFRAGVAAFLSAHSS